MATRILLAAALCAFLIPYAAKAQSAPSGFQEEFLGQFEASARKLVSLAEAMPADKMDWRPGEGVASVAEAYMHIARYNYYYPDVALGVGTELDYERLQGFVSEKGEVVRILSESMDHVRRVAGKMSAAPARHAHERAPRPVHRLRSHERGRAALVAVVLCGAAGSYVGAPTPEMRRRERARPG